MSTSRTELTDASGSGSSEPAAWLGSRRLRASGHQIERILDAVGEAITITEADGHLVFANTAALERIGVKTLDAALRADPEQLLGRFEITLEDGSPLDPPELPGRRVLRGEPAEPLLLRLVDRATGRLIWTLLQATQFEDDDGQPLAINVLQDVTDTKEQELRARFLSRASEVLTSSLDYQETLRRVARLAVPQIADWCGVEILDGDRIRQLAVAHADPAKLEFARELRERYPPRLDDPTGIGAVLRTGRKEFYPTIAKDLLSAAARDEEHLRLVRELHMRSVIIVPMRSRERVIGAISLVAAETAGAFNEDDLQFAEDFAARAASAIENARLYHERSETAKTLQDSLLPRRLPEIEAWRFSASYRPAGQIGGDFYDVFPVDDGFTIVLGDVTGKGVGAATLTALARHHTGAAALLGLTPAEILRLLNKVLLAQPELSLVTAVVARCINDGGTAKFLIASAGHPLPLRHRAGAPPAEVGTPGCLLGLDADADWPETTLEVEPGETLLFYTDGVTDTAGVDGRFEEARLRATLARSPTDPNRLLGEIERALRGFEAAQSRDDCAMLAAQSWR